MDKGNFSSYQMEIPTEMNIIHQIEKIYSETKIPENKQVFPIFKTKENWMAPLLAWVLPLFFSIVFTIIALVFMLKTEERFQYFKIIWSIIIIFAPLGWLIFFGIEILLPKFKNK